MKRIDRSSCAPVEERLHGIVMFDVQWEQLHSETVMTKKRSDAERREKQSYRFSRILRVLQLILGHGRWTIRSIAQELGYHERTIRRDLEVLMLAGVPWFVDPQEKCLRISRRDYRFPPLNLNDEELLGQAAATVITATPGLNVGGSARPTTSKLAAASREESARLLTDAEQVMSVLNLKLADHSRHREAIRTVQWALIQKKQLTGRYQSPYQRQSATLTLHPYRLCLVKQAWYLIARPIDKEQPRTYRITRFQSLQRLDAPAEVPEDFDLRDYFGDAWAVFREGKTYEVVVEFTPQVADLVTETVWHHTQKEQRKKDGKVVLSFHVDGLGEIAHWLLGWAGNARVIRPRELREILVRQLQAALKMNEEQE